MRITDLHVENFGVWQGLEIQDLPSTLTLFYGPNEAGKSTLLQFMRTILYGLSADRLRRFMPPVHPGRSGGTMTVELANGRFEIRRYFQDGHPAGGQQPAAVVSEHGQVQSPDVLTTVLGGVDESIFNNVFAVGLRELQHLGTLNDTEAAQHLYRIAGGLDRVSLVDVMHELATARTRILTGDGAPSQVVELDAERARLQREIDTLSAGTRSWAHLMTQRNALAEEIDALQNQRNKLTQSVRVIEIATAVCDDWNHLHRLKHELQAIGPLPDVPANVTDRLRQLDEQISEHRRQWEALKQQRLGLRARASEAKPSEALWHVTAQADALGRQAGWIASLHKQVQDLSNQADETEFEIQAELEQLGLPAGASLDSLPQVSGQTMSVLRTAARAVRERSQQLAEVRQAAAAGQADVDRVEQRVRGGLARWGGGDLVAAIERAGNRVTQLRKRLQLDDRLEQVNRHLLDLRQQNRMLLARQVLPFPILLGLGGLFALGTTMMLGGAFGSALALASAGRWLLMLVGLCVCGAVVVTKNVLEQASARELEACDRQLHLLRKERQTVTEECEELEQLLPRGGGPLASQLQTAQVELGELEELLPMDVQRRTVLENSEQARQLVSEADAGLREAKQRWAAALRSVGLSAELSPVQVKQLATAAQRLADRRRRWDQLRQERDQKRSELDAFVGRIRQLLVELGLTPEADSYEAQLRQLTSAASRQEQLAKQRDELRRQWRDVGRQQTQVARAARRLRRQRRELMIRFGAADENQLQQLVERRARADALGRQRDELAQKISTATGQVAQQTIERELTRNDPQQLVDRLQQLRDKLQHHEARLSQLHERRGELGEQIKALANHGRLAELRLQLGEVEQQLHDALGRWRVLAATSQVLQSVQRTYETERQPKTLADASGYLKRLSCGQYRRVWTPLGEATLRVEDRQGKSLPVEVLSRGAREQVFLSLRLALVDVYGLRGVHLPMVLDDVLVNFDTERAQAAAEVLRDFAGHGHQLLLLTCHQHIVKLFKSVKAEVRPLPDSVEVSAAYQRSLLAAEAKAKAAKKPRRRRPAASPAAASAAAAGNEPIVEDAQFFAHRLFAGQGGPGNGRLEADWQNEQHPTQPTVVSETDGTAKTPGDHELDGVEYLATEIPSHIERFETAFELVDADAADDDEQEKIDADLYEEVAADEEDEEIEAWDEEALNADAEEDLEEGDEDDELEDEELDEELEDEELEDEELEDDELEDDELEDEELEDEELEDEELEDEEELDEELEDSEDEEVWEEVDDQWEDDEDDQLEADAA